MKRCDYLNFHDCAYTKALFIIFLVKDENHFEIKYLVACTIFSLCTVCRCVISSIKKIFLS